MRRNLIEKFTTIVALSLLITANVFALGFESTRDKNKSTASNANWKTYNICGDSIQADFPDLPTESTGAEDSGYGTTAIVKKYSAVSGSSVYLVTCTDLAMDTEKLTSEEKKFVYEFSTKNFEQTMEQEMSARGFKVKVKLLPLRQTSTNGLSAFEQDFTVGQINGKLKFFMHGRNAFFAMTLGSTVKNNNTFLNSFKAISDKI